MRLVSVDGAGVERDPDARGSAQIELDFRDLAGPSEPQTLCAGAYVLRGFALEPMSRLLEAIDGVIERAPLRHMITPGGFRMSVAMTNCGVLGWMSDRRGYRYTGIDPQSGAPWPQMPDVFRVLARAAAERAGFAGFSPNACLINRYEPGARLTLHQDRDERDFRQPIVSVSIGLPAIFQFGGLKRSERTRRVPLRHGDVVVWGGPARLYHHGVLPLQPGVHELTGAARLNLTFRHVG
jgi:alkylated DNA repair protein (DNA oxidative demethylase)